MAINFDTGHALRHPGELTGLVDEAIQVAYVEAEPVLFRRTQQTETPPAGGDTCSADRP